MDMDIKAKLMTHNHTCLVTVH